MLAVDDRAGVACSKMTKTAKILLVLVALVALPAMLLAAWVLWRDGGGDGVAAVSVEAATAAEGAMGRLPTPTPEMSADAVMEVVLAALSDNDSPAKDAGLVTAFNFASPENQRATGPLPRFVEMVNGPVYAALIDHAAAEVSNISQPGEAGVTFRVVVTAGANCPISELRGQRVAYLWMLSRQEVPAVGKCWVTDGVALAPQQPEDDQKSRPRPSIGS